MPIESASEGSFGHMARAAGKMMDQMQKGFFIVSPDTWTPNVNLYETAGSYFVCVDLAGVDKEKIDVEVANGRLNLRGHRVVPTPEDLEAPAPPTPTAAGKPATATVAPARGSTPAASRQAAATPAHPPAARPAAATAAAATHGRADADAEPAAGRRARVHLMEIDHGQFSRDVDLPPDADQDTISANYRNGMLWVEIPKK